MKINFKKVLVWISSIVLVLTITLVVHIYVVTRHHETGVMRQLSRIDFTEPVDSTDAARIKSFVAHMEGVESTHFNVKDGILVYTYVIGKQTSENVFNRLMSSDNYKAKRYIVDAADLKKGCPMMDNTSVSYKLSSYISALFK